MASAPSSSSPFRASETEQASIRALKNWLLSAPPENALEDQIVQQRLAAAIAVLSEAQDWSHRSASTTSTGAEAGLTVD